MDALGALRPGQEPRATEFIGPMIAMIQQLIDSGHAYERQGHVLFRVRSYKDYGALSGRSIDDMIAGARVEVAPFKEDPMDFVLWKPSDADLPGWDSPWGKGRPGWHIECSAMSYELLGAHFDIHGGGLDLQFPHHENEIAQSACAHPGEGFANVWMHNEMLQVEGKKMSKSLGNFFTVRDLLDQGVPGEVIRFVLLGTHYSKPMDWTKEKAEQAEQLLSGFYNQTDGVIPALEVPLELVELLANDLNTAGAIALLHDYSANNRVAELKSAMGLLGFPEAENVAWFRSRHLHLAVANDPYRAHLLWPWLERWAALRTAKDYTGADILKCHIEAAGVILIATKLGPEAEVLPNFDASKLEGLVI
jgi:cysteinyl-tRNA synthetase